MAKRSGPVSVDEYLSSIPNDAKIALENLRKIIQNVAPKAIEVISYQIPTFKFKGRGLVAYSAHKKHYSLHLMSIALMDKYREELKSFTTTKASIHFTSAKPIPSVLVKKLIKERILENEKKLKKE